MVLKSFVSILKADTVIQSQRPSQYISWLSVAPFQINQNANKKVRTSIFSFVIGIVTYVFYICYLILNWSYTPVIIGGIISMTTILGFAIIKRQKLVNIVQNVIEVDEIFDRIGVKINYQRILLLNFVTTMSIMIYIVIFMCLGFNTYDSGIGLEHVVEYLTMYAVAHINITLMALKFFCITRFAQSRFRLINKVLNDILEDRRDQKADQELSPMHSVINIPSTVRQSPEKTIEQVSEIHNLLCDICETIGEYFNYPLLVNVGVSFVAILIRAYYIVAFFYYKVDAEDSKKYDYLADELNEMIMYIVILFLIVEATTSTIGNSSSSTAIVHKILNINSYNDAELKDRLFRLSSQMTNRKISFSAAGLFDLDRSLLFTVAGATTCYLIILVQSRPDDFIFGE